LDVMAAKIKQLEEKADQAEKDVAEMEAAIVSKRAEAVAMRTEARKAAQDYVRKQCEEAIAKLDSSVPQKPSNPYFMFSSHTRTCPEVQSLKISKEVNKKLAVMWKALTEEEKKEWRDKFDVEMKKWREWGDSEEGRRVLAERSEVLRKVKESGAEELAEALKAKAPEEGTPSKRRAAPGVEAQVVESPAKQHQVAPRVTRPAAPSKHFSSTEPCLDESVVAEADKAELLGQLRNLAGRPDVRALGKTDAELLDALKSSGGMVNAAKRVLLGEV